MNTIKQLNYQLEATYNTVPNPAIERYIATLVNIKIAEQLERVADALEAASKPEVHHMGADGLDEYRDELLDEDVNQLRHGATWTQEATDG